MSFWFITICHYWSKLISPNVRNFSSIHCKSRNVAVHEVSWHKSTLLRNALKKSFLHDGLSIQQAKHCGGVAWISWGGGVMVVLFSKRFPQLCEMFFSVREMNDPVMVNQAKFFPSAYTNRCASLYHLIKYVKINLYFWSCSYYIPL